MSRFGMVLHGGAGNLTRSVLSAEEYTTYTDAMKLALDTGYKILMDGGTASEAVAATVMYLEDCPLFNAGKGSVLNQHGNVEMDAAIMDGSALAAGAVAGVSIVKNPVQLAMTLMQKSPHVLLIGRQAEDYARTMGVPIEPEAYFILPGRLEQLQQDRSISLDHDRKFGTVGAVALDRKGDLAAATSTGGMNNKLPGRVGDSPLIGSGTYANNLSCAVSCTGHGEFFIRHVVAHSVASRIELLNEPLPEAASHLIQHTLLKAGGRGGLIAIDKNANIATPYNTPGMFRAYQLSTGEFYVGV